MTLSPPRLNSFIMVFNTASKEGFNKATKEDLELFLWCGITEYGLKPQRPSTHISRRIIVVIIVLCDDSTDMKDKDLFEQIDAMVAEIRCNEADSTFIR